jgi:hypothetical protein
MFAIQGRTAIPVRAIPIATGGCFDAHDIIDLFYDPETWACGPELRPIPEAFRIDAKGSITCVLATFWSLYRRRAIHQGNAAPDSLGQLSLLPPGVFVWEDQFRTFYSGIAMDAEAVRDSPAGAYPWNGVALLGEEQVSLIWEGFSSIRERPTAQRREQRNSREVHLRSLEQEIAEILVYATSRGLVVERSQMPGKKADLIRILTKRNPAREGRAPSTYSDDFGELGLRWVGGRKRTDSNSFLACFDLEPE